MSNLSKPILSEADLRALYSVSGLSAMEISHRLGCSAHKVVYWLEKYMIEKRTISEAIYRKHNPNGDPFTVKPVRTLSNMRLLGLGLGLYWGEGNKANRTAVRLGNTDPALLRIFMQFLVELFGVKKSDLRFALQLFSDMDVDKTLAYWAQELNVNPSQFYRPTVTISGSIGTYRKKSLYGVVTLHYHNKKLRDILVEMLPR